MKHILFVLISITFLQAQTNVFLNRDYWKTQPTVADVKDKIKDGNNPTEMNQWSFDATVYAIISNAPIETIKYLLTLPGNEVDKVTHDGRNYLLWAGYAGDYELVQHLLQKGSDILWKDEHHYDIITFTAVGGNTNPLLYDLYKKHGLVLKESQRKGANALLIAASSVDDIGELNYFIQNGMHWTDTDDYENNLFLSAAEKGNVKLLQQIIAKSVDYTAINKSGENAILIAAKGARRHSNSIETFIFLNELGLNPLHASTEGNNALHYLAHNNPNWDIYTYFIGLGVDANKSNKDGDTPFMIAIKYGNENVISELMNLVKDFDHQNLEGYTALSYAVSNLDIALVNNLLSKGVRTDVFTHDNQSLINLLFENYNAKEEQKFGEILNALVQQKVHPTINSKNGNTLFHIAVNQQAPILVKYAKQLGVDINKLNDEGLTPLHLAAMKSTNLKLLKELIANGANSRINTEFGEDAFVLALENELLDVSSDDLEFLKASNQ